MASLPARGIVPPPPAAAKAASILSAGAAAPAKPVKTMLGIDLKRRIVGTVNALGIGLRIKVFFRGTRAYTNGTMIVLPAIRDLAEIPYETARALIGYAVHEVAHIRYTDFAEVARAYDGGKLVKKFQNCIEDYRIERIMSRAFPGSASDLASLRIRIHPKLKSLTTGWLADPRACGPLALTWTGASLNNFANPHLQKTLDAIPDPVLALIRNWTDRMDDVQTTAETTDLAIAYADEAIRYAQRTQAPQTPKQPKEQDDASDATPEADGSDPTPQPQKPDQGDASSGVPSDPADADQKDDAQDEERTDDAPTSDEDMEGAPCGEGDGPGASGGQGEGDGDGDSGEAQEIADHESASEDGVSGDDDAEQADAAGGGREDDQSDETAAGGDADTERGSEETSDDAQTEGADSDAEPAGDETTDGAVDGSEDPSHTDADADGGTEAEADDGDASGDRDPSDDDRNREAGDDEPDVEDEGFGHVSTEDESDQDTSDADEERESETEPRDDAVEESTERPAGKPKGGDRNTESTSDDADAGSSERQRPQADDEADQSGVPEDQDDDDDDGPREGSADEVKDVHDEQDRESNGKPNQSDDQRDEDPFASVLDPNAAFDDFLDDLTEAIREAGPLPQQEPEASDGEVDPGQVVDDVAEANEAAPEYDSDQQTAGDDGEADPEERKSGRGAGKHDYDDARFTPIDLGASEGSQYNDLKNAASGTISTTARIIKRLLMAEERRGVLTNRRSGEFDIRNMSAIIRGTGNCYKKQWHRPAPRTLLATLVDFSGSMNHNMKNPGSKTRPLTLAMMGALALEEATRGTSIDTLLFGYTGWSPTVHLYPFKDGRQAQMQTRRLIGAYDACGMSLTPTGEAMSALALRMERAEQQRRIMLVLTDGTADDTRLCAEVSNLLMRRGIEVVAIGINCDAVAEWAPVHHVIDDISELPQALLSTIDPRKARQAQRRIAA